MIRLSDRRIGFFAVFFKKIKRFPMLYGLYYSEDFARI